MYVTRPLSLYKKTPEYMSVEPQEGPNSGCLVVQDEESLTPCCFGLCTSDDIEGLPLPSNKILKAGYDSDDDDVIFAIPVINRPLSTNRYYAIKAYRKHRGEAYVSSKDEDATVCCGGSQINDVKPRPLDPEDAYQQFEFSTATTGCSNNTVFLAKSVAPDSHPPRFLRERKFSISVGRSKDYIPGEANGINSSLRASHPHFNFPISWQYSVPVCVGTWYSPFMFINDGKVKDQVKKSMYYEIRLEQWWERIFTCERTYDQGNKVAMDIVVPTEVVAIGGNAAVKDGIDTNMKVVWFRTVESTRGELRVGLSSLLVERMIWEEERVGWVNGIEKQVRVKRGEEYGGIGSWARFGCYVLVERFVLKRMDGSSVMTFDFKHTHQIKTKWE